MDAWWPWDEDRTGQPFLVRGEPTNGIPPGELDRSVEVIMGDVEDPMTDAERTDADYHGVDRSGTPTYDFLTDDPSKYL